MFKIVSNDICEERLSSQYIEHVNGIDMWQSSETMFSRHIVVKDDKPIDHIALQYALLKCAEGVSVNCPGEFCFSSDGNVNPAYADWEKEVPETLEEYEELFPELSGMNSCFPTNISNSTLLFHSECFSIPETFLARVMESTADSDSTEEVLETLNSAYDYYSSIYRAPKKHETAIVNKYGLRFSKTKNGRLTIYESNLDSLQKALFSKAACQVAMDYNLKVRAVFCKSDGLLYALNNETDEEIDNNVFFKSVSMHAKNRKISLLISDYDNYINLKIYFKGDDNFDEFMRCIVTYIKKGKNNARKE